jgi:hypothetical protein
MQSLLILETERIAYLFFPLLGGVLLQGLGFRYGWLKGISHPIDFRLHYRGRRIFGDNKTFRGMLGAAVGCSLFAVLQFEILHHNSWLASLEYFDYATINPVLFGLCLGLANSLGELPNSFLKRQLGIAPGKSATGIWRGIFYFLDQVDVLLGIWLYLSFIMEISITKIAISIVFVFSTHQLITVVGYGFGMRKTSR